MLYETRFLISLFLTLIIEIPVVFWLIKYIFKIKTKNSRIFFSAAIASILTLPYLWFVMPSYINATYYLFIGEFIVFLVEAIIYWQLFEIKYWKAILISLIANILSFVVGIFLFSLVF